MTQLPWETVVAALKALGCVVAKESDHRVHLVRGAAVLQVVQKMSPVTIKIQEHLLHAFSFECDEYLEAVARTSAPP